MTEDEVRLGMRSLIAQNRYQNGEVAPVEAVAIHFQGGNVEMTRILEMAKEEFEVAGLRPLQG